MSAPQGYIDPNFPNPLGPGDASIIIYGYTPSFALAVIASALFFLSLVVHLIQVVRYRTPYFSVLSIGLGLEVLGYVFRALSSRLDPYRVAFFVAQYFCIVVAPVFFSAAIYLVLQKLLLLAPLSKPLPLSPRSIIVIFLSFDLVTTVVQIVGAALIGSAESNRRSPTTPNNILLAGLSIQVASFGFFIVILALFTTRFLGEKSSSHVDVGRARIMIVTLSLCAALVELRTAFRLAETAQGVFGYLSSHEILFAFLEFLPILLTVLLFNAVHPGRFVRSAGTVRNVV
ncbi:hypothetical protein HKX48_009533 [Thoreauomyces humboldtii]|nr:hypothetical protein HKX48_009533 [Thoreauomyces humboldtii]